MLSVLVRDEGHLLKMLHKHEVASERGEEERAIIQNWACDFVTAEMAAPLWPGESLGCALSYDP